MEVVVYNNDIEKALRILKKKLSKDGLYTELKERRFYDKPSVKKKKKAIKAAKRKLKKKGRRRQTFKKR